MRIAESELIINSDGSVFHLHLKPGEIADKIIVVGDPDRADMVASFFDTREFRRQSREFVTITGQYKGERITALSTGIGTDNIDIVMNELDALANIDFETREVKPEHKTLTILRIGTTGAIQPEVPLGSFIFSHMSIGFDGLLNWYADWDKVCMPSMEEAFKKHMNWNPRLTSPYFVKASQSMIDLFSDTTVKGMNVSSPGFYGPQGRVIRMGLCMPDLLERLESFECDGCKVTNFEMESSAIYGLAAHLGHEAGTVCLAIAHRYLKSANADYKPLMKELIVMCLDKLAQ